MLLKQLLEGDLVYARDISRPELLDDEQLKRLALVAHACYQSFDLAMHCLMHLEGRGAVPAGTRELYLEAVRAG